MTNVKQPIALTRHEESREVVTPIQKQPTVKVPLCEGCQSYHGSTTAELECMRDSLRNARAENTATRTSLKDQLQAARVEAATLRTELGSKTE